MTTGRFSEAMSYVPEDGICREVILTSSVSGERFRLAIWKPAKHKSRLRCIYVFDGDDHFGMMTRQASAYALAGGDAPAVVAIGYPPNARTVERRIFDLTPPAAQYIMPDRPNGAPWPQLGGGDDLLKTVEQDAKPLVAEFCGKLPSEATLFGHSLGGLMALYAFSLYTEKYDRYFASSPSIWFNDRSILNTVERRLNAAILQPVALQVTVGSAEEYLVMKKRCGPSADPAKRAAWIAGNRMVSNVRDLARIVGRRQLPNLDFSWSECIGADHHSVLPFAIQKAVCSSWVN